MTEDPLSALVRTEIERTPGVTVDDATRQGARLRLRMTGRGPSLHATRLSADVQFGRDSDHEDGLRAISAILTIQARRHAAAAAIGLPTGEPVALGRFDHMVVDALLSRIVERDGDDRGATVRDMLDTYIAGGALLRETTDAASTVYKRDGIVLRDGDGGDPRPRVMVYRDCGAFAFDGEMLVLRGVFPDTVANALGGRTVADVVELPDAFSRLHARRILDAENLGPALALRTEAEWIALP